MRLFITLLKDIKTITNKVINFTKAIFLWRINCIRRKISICESKIYDFWSEKFGVGGLRASTAGFGFKGTIVGSNLDRTNNLENF